MDEIISSTAQSRTVGAGHAVDWYKQAWALFMRAPGMWVVFAIIVVVAGLLIGSIPLLGQVALPLLMPVLFGGWLLAVGKLDSGGTLAVGDLFSGFDKYLTPLLVVGAINMGASIVVAIIGGVIGMGAVFGGVASGVAESGTGMMAAAGAGLLAFLLMFVLFILIGMAMWFAPALVVLQQRPPVDAVKESFAAALKNIPALALFSVINLLAGSLAMLTFGLGWLVLLPVLALTMWVSYHDVFAKA